MAEKGGVWEIPFVVLFVMLMFVAHARARARARVRNSDLTKIFFSELNPDELYSIYCNIKCSKQCPEPPCVYVDPCVSACF